MQISIVFCSKGGKSYNYGREQWSMVYTFTLLTHSKIIIQPRGGRKAEM
jgi:hypothetical protein